MSGPAGGESPRDIPLIEFGGALYETSRPVSPATAGYMGRSAADGFGHNLSLVPQGEHASLREDEVYRLNRDPDTYEVSVESDVTLEDIRESMNPDDWQAILDWAEPLQGKTVVTINPTMEGGGVAMMRPPLIHMMNELGLDAHWFVMEHTKDPDPAKNPFLVTKGMHNVSQRMPGQELTEEGKKIHQDWADGENGPILERQDPIISADFLIIDDPQPAPLIGRLKGVNPDAKVVWRNHIDTSNHLMSDPSTPQGVIAAYLLEECGVRDVDAVLAHPVEEFIHPGMRDKTYFGPATIDPFDNLNRHLDEDEITAGIEFINSEIGIKNDELIAAGRTADVQPLLNLDPNTPRITLIARFDPSKGMDKAMELGVLTRKNMREAGVPEDELPEVVIVGNGSIDDPDGERMQEEMMAIRREIYPDEKNAITLMRLKHNYDAMNALMSRSTIVMQTSDAEGLETRVSDGIKHGVPAVVSNRGGIKTQVFEGESGLILDYDKPGNDLDRGAEFMSKLLMDPEAYAKIADSTKKLGQSYNAREFVTPANVARFLRIFNRLIDSPGAPADKLWKMSELTADKVQADQLAA